MLVSLYVFMFRIVSLAFSIVLALANLALRYLVSRFLPSSTRRILPGVHIDPPTQSNDSRCVSDSNTSLSQSYFASRGLSLPQILAAHPEQWSALEAQARLSIRDTEQVANNSPEVANRQLAFSPSLESSTIPLRRSRRTRRSSAIHSS